MMFYIECIFSNQIFGKPRDSCCCRGDMASDPCFAVACNSLIGNNTYKHELADMEGFDDADNLHYWSHCENMNAKPRS